MWLSEPTHAVVLPATMRSRPSARAARDDLVARGVKRESIRVIFPGIDSTHYTPDPSVRESKPVFAYLGRLKKYKGVDLVIRAFALSEIPGATLEIAARW